MAVITGKQFTVKVGTTDYSTVITAGNVSGTATSDTIQTLAGTETVSQGPEDTASLEFLYDGATGLYKVLRDAYAAGTPLAIEIVGDDGKHTGSASIVSSLSLDYPADGAATCSVEMSGLLTFAASTP